MRIQINVDSESCAADIPEMRAMPLDGYASYIANDLFFIDHHDILRAVIGEYPIATTADQTEQLICYLQGIALRMRAAE
ncbi:hypothetical protein [Pseudomonas sp. 5P_3.1_Bac2]|uniref:hypothetical protein n=1 Tax=Pseudomonas sp. 5P_3.1_Bac2 TaxID=2971617 RepID=UPI0021C5D839|nr:hypothetical protein [Pseudomonas sp. 5P_3.1_Bac2]MCU1717328.1 hypothetical protein [Pseudomonas sp. 5P_3.1_Bac2]